MKPTPLAIPKTSPTRYLSGIVALNILSERGTGDWHQDIFLRSRSSAPRSFLVERGQPFDPSALLEEDGIYDASPVLDAMHIAHPAGPVFAADHARAIADLVLGAVLRGESPAFVALDDWMPRPTDKHEVLVLLDKAAPHLQEHQTDAICQWVKRGLQTEKLQHGRSF